MFKDLSPNLKSSITRSITQTFEQYMSDIEWSGEKFSIDDYIASWREYITVKALWYSKIPEDMKIDPEFHEDLAQRINEIIARSSVSRHLKNKLWQSKACRKSLIRIMSITVKPKRYTLTHCLKNI